MLLWSRFVLSFILVIEATVKHLFLVYPVCFLNLALSNAFLICLVSSKPRGLRAVSVTASQINLAWNAPERVYGVLNGYKVRETGKLQSSHFFGNF